MGSRGGGRKPRSKPESKGKLEQDMYDDIDKFHLSDEDLDMQDDDTQPGNEEEEDVEAVLDFSDEDSDADVEAGGKLAKIITAERAIKRKLAMQAGTTGKSDDEESDDDDEDDDRVWGTKKNEYYNAEDVDSDFESDDEIAEEEEAEALRLQKEQAAKLSAADFKAAAEETGSEEEEETGADASMGAELKGTEAVRIERSAREAAGVSVSAEDRRAAVLRDSPMLLTLLSDIASSVSEVRSRTGPLLREVQGGGLATTEGISYLEAKHMLLLSYCMQSLFFLLLKLEGRPTRDHPVIQRLVTAKAFLEKLRPIDKRLRQQIDKLLRAAEGATAHAAIAGDEADPASFKANPDAFVSPEDDDDTAAAGVYRPPKITAMAMDGEESGGGRGSALRGPRRERAALRNAANNQYVRDLDAEAGGLPEEVRGMGGDVGGDTVAALKQKQALEARAEVEEDLMMRVPLSKEERKKLKASRRAGLSGSAVLGDFADDCAGVLAGGAPGEEGRFHDKLRLSQKFGADLSAGQAALPSGDADLGGKPALSQRRAKYDALKARQQAQLDALAEDAAAGKRPRGHEDAFYLDVSANAAAKKAEKARKKRKPDLHPPVADPSSAEPRSITTEIQANRGLTPHRRKDIKNPRKHARMKHADAEKRRKGQVQSVKKQEGPYAGEATGIKAKISKSTRLS